MKKKLAFAFVGLAAVAWVATMPHGAIVPTSKFTVEERGQPFGTSNAPAPFASAKPVGAELAIVKTASVSVPEVLTFAGGSISQNAKIAFSAFVIRHGNRVIAFDLGLGSMIDEQYGSDMPYWARTSFRYEHPVVPLKAQWPKAGSLTIDDVILSHSHWDHAAGLEDFPKAKIWVSSEEFGHLKNMSRGAGSPWPSQVGRADIKWNILELTDGPYKGFESSLDLFGDGSVVAVKLAGHTPGSLALFVTVKSGKRYFLVGDAVWSAKAIPERRAKFIGASLFVDGDRSKTSEIVERLAYLIRDDPGLTIIPAHDGDLQERLGLFPKWLD